MVKTLKERVEEILKEKRNNAFVIMVKSDETKIRYALDTTTGLFNYRPLEDWLVVGEETDYDEDEYCEFININVTRK